MRGKHHAMPLVFFPRAMAQPAHLLLWGASSPDLGALHWLRAGDDQQTQIVGADGTLRTVQGVKLPLLGSAMQLSAIHARLLAELPASIASWALASKFALELASLQLIVPTVELRHGGVFARWVASLASPEQMYKLHQIVQVMPPSSHAVPTRPDAPAAFGRSAQRESEHRDGSAAISWKVEALVRRFLDDTVDAMVRAVNGTPQLPSMPQRSKQRFGATPVLRKGATIRTAWPDRYTDALVQADDSFVTVGLAERHVVAELQRWSDTARGSTDRWRACFRLDIVTTRSDEPADLDDDEVVQPAPFALQFLLQAPHDLSLLITAKEVWNDQGRHLKRYATTEDPQETLLEALGRAARLFPPIAAALTVPRPVQVKLDAASAWTFFCDGAAALSAAGFVVMLPAELTAGGQRRLRIVHRISAAGGNRGTKSNGNSVLGMDELLQIDWEAAVDDETLSAADIADLAKHKAPLVQWRGKWVVIDPILLADMQKMMERGPQPIKAQEALRLALLAARSNQTASSSTLDTTVIAPDSRLAYVLAQLRSAAQNNATGPAPQPPLVRSMLGPAPQPPLVRSMLGPVALQAQLRPYQARGLAWMSTLCSLGLGGCLADDMGLGKTVQTIALILAQTATGDAPGRHGKRTANAPRPTLLVMPTSVLGNWHQECLKFAPLLHVVIHHGAGRINNTTQLDGLLRQYPRLVLATSFSMLRQDIDWLATYEFGIIIIDEAQNIKTANAAVSIAARRLRGRHRFALTGTPVENRLSELWSILEFANPGLLGPREEFRREFEIPIERHGNGEAASRLRSLIGPFVLRRVKSDPSIISDLPAKNEMKVACTLSAEQASLYQAIVDEEIRRIEAADGMARRGRVLALLSFLKQICNHPALYLADGSGLVATKSNAERDNDLLAGIEHTELGRSGKLDRLTAMLAEVLACGDKALVFTQFHQMGKMLQTHLQGTTGVEVLFLHGGTTLQERQQMIERFSNANHHSPRIFVLTVKAGGTGINLTAANHVFHFDRWWNPAVEDQATDRAYRIGQHKIVSVHKFVCIGTVEEKIDLMLSQKKALADNVIGSSEQWITELNNQQLRQLFALTPSVSHSAEAPQLRPKSKPRLPS
jgi:SNF2 family DNA or RNA helicase